MKTCNRCGETKPITEFGKSASTRDGLNYWCKHCNSIAATKWAAANRDKVNAAKAKRYAENPDLVKAHNAKWAAGNADRVRAYKAKWRAENPERQKALVAKWAAENPEARRIHSQNRRARKRANGGRLSPGLADKLFKLQRGKCACCHVSIDNGNHLDHVIPVALEGPNEDWNMQLLCATCNLSKGARHPVEFMQSRGLLL